jgi:hypothetical protein
MKAPEIVWKITDGGEAAYLGKWKVGGWFNSAFVSRGDPKNIAASCLLPQIKPDLGRFITSEEARVVITGAIELWFLKLDE